LLSGLAKRLLLQDVFEFEQAIPHSRVFRHAEHLRGQRTKELAMKEADRTVHQSTGLEVILDAKSLARPAVLHENSA